MKSLVFICAVICLAACTDVSTSSPTLTATRIGVITETAIGTPIPSPAIATDLPLATDTPAATSTLVPSSTPMPTFVPVSLGTPVHQSSSVISPNKVDQISELAHWGRGVINDVAYSGNGRWIAVGTTTGAYIHDARDLGVSPIFFETADSVKLIDISLNGDMIAMAFDNGSLELWDVAKQEMKWVKEAEAYEMQFSPDGQALTAVVTVDRDSQGIVWSLPDGEIIQEFSNLFAMQFSDDSKELAIWEYGALSVYDWPSGSLVRQVEPILFSEVGEDEIGIEGTLISDMQFSAQGEPILLNLPSNGVYGPTGRVEFQQGGDNTLLLSLPPIELLSFPVQSACNVPLYYADPPARPHAWQFELLPQEQIAAIKYETSGYGDDNRRYTSVRVHRIDDGRQLYIQEGVNDFAFSPDGETWVSGLEDGRLQIRQITDGAILQTFDGYESPALGVIVSPDNQIIAVEYMDEVKLYRVEDGTVLQRYSANQVVFAPDGHSIALGYEDGHVELRSIADDSLLNSFFSHEEAVTALAFSPAGDTLFSASMDCKIDAWQLLEGKLSKQLDNYLVAGLRADDELVPLRVWDMFVTPDGKNLVGQFSSSIGIWQLPDGIPQELLEAQYHIDAIALSSHGDYLAVVDPIMLRQRLPTGEIQEKWQLEIDADAVAFSSDGQLLFTGSNRINGGLALYLADKGEVIHRLSSGTLGVTALSVAPNGHFFVSSSRDGVIRIWGIP